MKKIIALLSVFAMIFCFASCGGTATEKTTAEETTLCTGVEVEALLSETGGYLEYTYSDHVLNEKGQVVSRRVKGDSNRTDTFEYDEEGRIVKNVRTSAYGDEIYTYTYDEKGLLVEEFQGDRTFNNTYTLDENGRILTKTSVNADGGYTMVYTYTYNDDGTVATETQQSERSTYVITFTYDEKGRVATETSCKEGESGSVVTRYTYGVVGYIYP